MTHWLDEQWDEKTDYIPNIMEGYDWNDLLIYVHCKVNNYVYNPRLSKALSLSLLDLSKGLYYEYKKEKCYRVGTKYRSDSCIGCNEWSDYILHNGRKWIGYCDKCRIQKKKETHIQCSKRAIDKIKKIVFDHYGNICAYCGATEKLSIDHMDGKGKEHREAGLYGGGLMWYYWLRDNEFPKGFQTLCTTCNFMKGSMSDSEFRAYIMKIYNRLSIAIKKGSKIE